MGKLPGQSHDEIAQAVFYVIRACPAKLGHALIT